MFELQPGSEFKFMVILIVFFLILAIGSFYLDAWIKKQPHRNAIKKLLPHFPNRLRILGIIGFVLLFFRYENIPYFAMRILLVLLLLGIISYIGYSLYKFKKHLPELLETRKKKKTHHKYLPKSKKKKKKKR